MTAPVETPVAPSAHPASGEVFAPQPQSDGEVPRAPATELPEVVTGSTGNLFAAANGTASRNEANNDPFKLSSSFAYTPRKIKVFTIGAGFSGLLMAHKFQHRFPDMRDIVEHTIFEARSEVGGTWFVNNYPGVQCDVPAHIYVSQDNTKPQPQYIPSRISLTAYYRPSHLIQIRIGAASMRAVRIFSIISRVPSRNGTWTATCSLTPR